MFTQVGKENQMTKTPTKLSIITKTGATSPVALDTPVQGSSTLTPLHELTPDPRYGSVQQPILSLNVLTSERQVEEAELQDIPPDSLDSQEIDGS
uniref:Uncharacterized protein n=1 Tax=Amphimedon queenslandica TaxID=400682 RepID=A0A1X7TTR5_AMPQE